MVQQRTYDRLDRLVECRDLAANVFEYDRLGNRTSKSLSGLDYTYDSRNRLAQVSGPLSNPEVGSYTFDDQGRLRVDVAGTYEYSRFDMLERATSMAGTSTVYRYDGDNLRKARIGAHGTDFFFHGPGELVLSEFVQPWTEEAPEWAPTTSISARACVRPCPARRPRRGRRVRGASPIVSEAPARSASPSGSRRRRH